MTPLSIAYPSIDPVAVHLGPLSVRWYGLAYVAGFVAAWLVLRWLNKRWDVGLTLDDQLSILLAAVIGVLLGGRIGYVLFYNLAYYVGHPAAILALWDGCLLYTSPSPRD